MFRLSQLLGQQYSFRNLSKKRERNNMIDIFFNNIKTPFDTKEVKDRIKKLDRLLKDDTSLYNHLTRNGYIEYILNGDTFTYKQ